MSEIKRPSELLKDAFDSNAKARSIADEAVRTFQTARTATCNQFPPSRPGDSPIPLILA